MPMYQVVDQMSQYLTSDYFPLSLCLNVPQSVVKVQASDDVYIGTRLQMVDWGQSPNDKSPGIDGLVSEHFTNASYRLNLV